MGGLELLSVVDKMRGIASSLIPKVCTGAVSPTNYLNMMCDGMYGEEGSVMKGPPLIVVHRGRDCPIWTYNIMGESTEPVDLVTCASEASKLEFTAFIHKRLPEGVKEPNCLSHEEWGKMPQVKGCGDSK